MRGGFLVENKQSELEIEKQWLEQTIHLAKEQLEKAKHDNENNKVAIIESKREMRENSVHSIANLWSSEAFEDLAALSQYVNPVLNKIADYEETENKIQLLEKLINSPYFARIDFKFEEEDTFEKIYIGRSSLKKDDSFDMVVYDWRSPIASVFYRFVTGQVYYEAPNGRISGEVNLKRQYEINKSVLEYFFDADVQIIDEFLRKLLSKNTSSKMKTVVETIQKEQDIIIRDMENELMMVQGVAGSGKTSIALHRAAYLMYQGLSSKLKANNIIIISPNALFEQYISNVLPELGEENVVSAVFEEILSAILEKEYLQTRNEFLEKVITKTSYRDIIKSSIEFKTSHQFMEILNRFMKDIPNRWIPFEDVYFNGVCVLSKEQLKDRIILRKKGTPLGLKLKELEEFILETVYETKERHKKFEISILKKEIKKFTEFDVESLYRKLLDEEEYFYDLAEDIELPDCIEDILRFTRENLSAGLLCYDDTPALAYMKVKLSNMNPYVNIKQVVIDEAQDYYPLHFEIFGLLFKNAKYTILGDINQTLEKQEDISLYEKISNILNKKKSTLITMDKSFRCTNEILQYSSKFISHNIEIKSFNRSGLEPKVHVAGDQGSLNHMIISEAKSCLEMGYQSIGFICKSEKNAISLYKGLKDKIDVQLIKNDSTEDLKGVFIIPVYMSKGLEFDAVLICDVDNKNYSSEDDKKLLYIGCTRALHRLNLFCKGEVSPLL